MQQRTPEEYRQELLRLYQSAHPRQETVSTDAPAPSPAPTPEADTPPEPSPEPPASETPQLTAEPDPIPEDNTPTSDTEQPEPPAEQTEVGWLQVITRSAGNARAVPGVSVRITSGTQMQKQLEYVSVTNESGETPKIELPVPAASLSLNCNETRKPYSSYDVSIYADGFYRQVSEAVPVFAGTTSRQIFHMIPLPSYLQEPPKTIVYQNTEPNL
ncbi:hypothetical protein [uncultured Ruminococcus sp.]|uniref:hypothetical protein n=1 Tax=uncultured Ruminococcus sp. TaxID=165186 RepID=UPI0025D98499|nr:hypothetical protein [uncultured Ruminococcus sp.]